MERRKSQQTQGRSRTTRKIKRKRGLASEVLPAVGQRRGRNFRETEGRGGGGAVSAVGQKSVMSG